jgi:hypothetical protein
LTPTLPVCVILSPPTTAEPVKPVQQAVNEVVSVINTVTVNVGGSAPSSGPATVLLASRDPAPSASASTSSGSGTAGPAAAASASNDSTSEKSSDSAAQKSDDKKADKKEDKKEDSESATAKPGVKKDDAAKKMYCN